MARFDDGAFPGYHKSCPKCGRIGVSAHMNLCRICEGKERDARNKAVDKYYELMADIVRAFTYDFEMSSEKIKKDPKSYKFLRNILTKHGIRP